MHLLSDLVLEVRLRLSLKISQSECRESWSWTIFLIIMIMEMRAVCSDVWGGERGTFTEIVRVRLPAGNAGKIWVKSKS